MLYVTILNNNILFQEKMVESTDNTFSLTQANMVAPGELTGDDIPN